MKPDISVLVVTYNHSSYIETCITSILRQVTDRNVEIVIANDASTDDTDEIVRRLIIDIPTNFCVNYIIRERNLGPARNFYDALNVLNGRYVAILDGDDYWIDDTKLQRHFDLLETDARVVYVSDKSVVGDREGLYAVPIDSDEGCLPLLCEWPCKYWVGFPLLGAGMWRRSLVQSFPSDLILCPNGDQAIHQFISAAGLYCQFPLYSHVYRQTNAGAWTSLSKAKAVWCHHQTFKVIRNHIHTDSVVDASLFWSKWCIEEYADVRDLTVIVECAQNYLQICLPRIVSQIKDFLKYGAIFLFPTILVQYKAYKNASARDKAVH